MANLDLRQKMMFAGVKQWKVAELLGISESMFSKMLRKELSENKKQEIKMIIDKLNGQVMGQ